MFKSSIGERAPELHANLAEAAHVWLSDLEVWQRAPLLTAADEDRARTLRHPDAQKSFVAGRSLLRFALSHYETIEPSSWEFSASRLGRPEIAGPEPVPRLRFNLSHTRGLVACVVTRTADCGVDVERLERPLRPLRIAEHSFAAEEFHDLRGRMDSDLRQRFFCYWTLKESFYKARGSGIPFRMTGARFGLGSPTGIDFMPSAEEGTAAEDWQFALYRPTAEHVLALALAPGAGPRLEIRWFVDADDDAGPRFAESSVTAVRATAQEIVA